MKLKQIVVSIENAPGRLFEVTNALGEAGINLRALNLVDTGAFGQLRLLVSDVPTARRILMELQIPAYVNEVVAAEDLQDAALAFAQRLAEGAPLALRYTKQAVNAGIKAIALQSFDVATALEIATFRSDDHREALAAIRERLRPRLEARQASERGARRARRDVLVCAGGGCVSSRSPAVADALEQAIAEAGLEERARVVRVGCMGLCEAAPLLLVSPDGVLYRNVDEEGARRIVGASNPSQNFQRFRRQHDAKIDGQDDLFFTLLSHLDLYDGCIGNDDRAICQCKRTDRCQDEGLHGRIQDRPARG